MGKLVSPIRAQYLHRSGPMRVEHSTLKQTNNEKGRVTRTMVKEMEVSSQPQRLVPRSSSEQGKSD